MKKNYLIAMAIVAGMFSNSWAQSQRSCGTMHHLQQQMQSDPGLLQRMDNIETQTQQLISHPSANRTAAVVTIPVVVHVVYNTTAQNISDSQILSQIEVLNEDFRKLNVDVSNLPAAFSGLAADCQIQFCLAQRDPNGAATTGIIRKSTTVTSFSDNDNIKRAANGGDNAWTSTQFLNVWVGNLSGGLLGYAQFPGGAASTDGVVILYNAFGRTGNVAAPYNKGRSATHEIGHWLNLRHIWGDASCGNDQVTDTPNQSTSNFGCPSFPHVTCSNGPNGDLFMNYMDYTDDACMYMFTNGQSSRMTASINASRAGLLTSQGCVPPAATCNVPSALAVSSITTSSATLSWGAVSGATSYNVQYRIVGTSTWSTAGSASTSIAVSSLSASSNYEFQVQTVCSGGNSAFSTSATFTTSAAPTCNVPAALAASSITTSSATLSWGSVTGATSYNVQYRIIGAASWISISSNSTSAAISSLTASTNYEFQVQTVCSFGNSAFSTPAPFTTSAVAAGCGIPTGLTASNITSSTVTLGWAVSANATSYRVQYRVNGTSAWTVKTATSNTKPLTGLTSLTAYDFRVANVCNSGAGTYSGISTFTTTNVSACTDTYEPNNTVAAAKAITTNSDVYGTIGTATDNDFYSFSTVAGSTNIKITLDQLPADYDLRLINATTGAVLKTSQNVGTTAESITRNTTAAGSYLVRVYGFSGALNTTSCYHLLVNTGSSNFREMSPESVVSQKMNGIGELSVYPNPTDEKLNLNFFIDENTDVQVTVVDMLGKSVMNTTVGAQQGFNQSSFDMSSLNNGIYFLRVQQNNQTVVKKFVVKH